MPRPPDSFAENPVYHIPAGPVHPEKIETDFFAGRLPPSRDREAAADTFCSPCTYPEGETSGQAVCRTGVWYVWQAPTEE